jgi:Helix-turn-helix domain
MSSGTLFLADAAKYVHTTESNLRWYRYTGEGPASYVIGRRLVYDIVDLDAWLAEQKAKTLRGGVKPANGSGK